MSDQKLRDLERRWKETGSPDDEAAYLLERVRVGDLSQERLELAAYCGHEGAQVAAGYTAPMALRNWLGGLNRWSAEVGVRVAIAAGKVLQRREDVVAAAAAEAWLRDKTAQAAANVRFAVREVRAAEGGSLARPVNSIEQAVAAAGLLMIERSGLAGFGDKDCPPSRDETSADPATACKWALAAATDIVEAAAHAHGEAAVRRALVSTLVEWSLGVTTLRSSRG